MTTQAEVVIVGGAAMGSACAYFLRALGARGRIVIVERDPSYLRCATARSAGGLRTQFSTPENIALSRASLEIIRQRGWEIEVTFREQGYLILASDSGLGVLRENFTLQRSNAADVVLEDGGALARRFPWLNADGIAAGVLGLSGEGWLDPVGLMTALRREARAQGVEVVTGEVVGIEKSADRIEAVRLSNGERIACATLINTAGPQAGAVAAMAGVALPVEPRKRFVYVLDCRAPPESLRRAPLTVDPSGVWFRPEGATFICGRSPDEDQEPTDIADLDAIDHAFFEERIWPDLAARVPAFEAIKVMSAWAGHYDYNTLDQNGVIGRHPEVGNLYFCNGFSGHGIQQAPAAGRAVAELILQGRFVTIDLARFGYERIVRGEALLERNVI